MSDTVAEALPSERPLAESSSSADADAAGADPAAENDDDVRAGTERETYKIDGVEYSVHRIAQLFPLIEGDEFDELVKDVQAHGLRHPVVRRGTEIIDGRNRVRAALRAGVGVPFIDLEPNEHPVRRIVSENMHTRMLSSSEKARIAARIRKDAPGAFGVAPTGLSGAVLGQAPPGAGKPAGKGARPAADSSRPTPDPDADTVAEAADALAETPGGKPSVLQDEVSRHIGVSAEYTRQAERIEEEAPELSPYLGEGKGKVTVRDAYAIRGEAPAVRKQALADVRAGRAKTLVEAVRAITGDAPKRQPAAQQRKPKATPPTAPKGDGPARPSLPPLPTAGNKPASAGTASPAPSAAGPAASAAQKNPPGAAAPAAGAPAAAAARAAAPTLPKPAVGGGPAAKPSASDTSAAASSPASVGAPPPPATVAVSSLGDYSDVHPDLMVPPLLLASLRGVLERIDLDPCSTADAQDRVAAGEWYSADQDGLSHGWRGNVWAFPPLPAAGTFAGKLVSELRLPSVRRAALLVPADLRDDWALRLLAAPTFSALVVERGRGQFQIAGESTKVRLPTPMALFLFGMPEHSQALLVKKLSVWGRILINADGQPL